MLTFKRNLSLLLFILMCITTHSQTTKSVFPFTIRAAYVAVDHTPIYAHLSMVDEQHSEYNFDDDKYFHSDTKYHTFRLDVNYRWNNWLETGLWGGYGYNDDHINCHLILSGIKTNAYLLPLFIHNLKNKKIHFDLYASVELGNMYYKNNITVISMDGQEQNFGNASKWTATGGIGFAFYFQEYFGLYAEYQYGAILNKQVLDENRALSIPKIGLTFRF